MIHDALLILSWCAPLFTALTLIGASRLAWNAMPLAALPGLAAALLVPAGSMVELPALLVGTRFGLDQTGAVFLFFTAAIWVLAGWHALGYITTRKRSFCAFFLLAMAGNFGLVLAQDMVGFYLFFALMSFSSYGLVVHDRTPQVFHAGRVYIILVILGEVLIFSGMTGVASFAGSTSFTEIGAGWVGQPWGGLLFGALVIGFGIKAGALPLHVWLPLAHPAAPTPASAVLSGAMIKAGLLGWLRFLPIGEAAFPGWAVVFGALGAAAFVGAVAYGCFQSNPKALLAYSSISKMGLMTMGVGVVLAYPGSEEKIVSCILIFATHHCLCKGALFFSVSVHRKDARYAQLQWLVTTLLLIPPLSMAGFALTGGAVAKTVMKSGMTEYVSAQVSGGLLLLLLLNGIVTAVLMFRFCWQNLTASHHNHSPPGAAAYGAWVVSVLAVAGSPLLLKALFPSIDFGSAFTAAAAWQAAWPVLAACSVGAFFVWRVQYGVFSLPAGDLLVFVDMFARAFRAVPASLFHYLEKLNGAKLLHFFIAALDAKRFYNLLDMAESRLGRAAVFGLTFIGLLTFCTLLLLLQI